jgi:hypothetical protein
LLARSMPSAAMENPYDAAITPRPQRMTATAQASGGWRGHASHQSHTQGVARCGPPRVGIGPDCLVGDHEEIDFMLTRPLPAPERGAEFPTIPSFFCRLVDDVVY